MITRNLSRHIKEQNWFAVVVDFTVVVSGIFIGLQAADWNQARLDRQEGAYHLNFLYEELVAAIDAAETEIAENEATLRSSFEANMLLGKESWTAEDVAAFKELVFSTYRLWGPKRRPVSLRRLIDDGKLDLLDRDMQKAVLQFESAYIDAIEQTETSYSYSLQLTPKITASMKFRGRQNLSTATELTSNQTLRSAVRDKAIWQRIQLDVLVKLQSARLELKQALEEHAPELVL